MAEQLPSDLVITEVTFQPQDVERSMNHFIGSLLMGLMPMALSSSELFRPMAIALISGLLVATLLTLVVIPLLYQWMEERFTVASGML